MPLDTLEIRRQTSVRRQVTDGVRKRIQSGQLKTGERLPSSQELARMWQTDLKTIQRAMTPLVQEGLLERTPGAGTFVRQQEERLTRVGVYVSGDTDANGGSPFGRVMLAALAQQLRETGIELDVWMDPRTKEEREQPWAELVRAVQQRRVQGIIGLGVREVELRWLTKLPVPSSAMTSMRLPNTVHTDLRQLAEASITALAEQGCRSVGVITHLLHPAANRTPQVPEHVEFYRRLAEVATDRGLSMSGQWLRYPAQVLPGGLWGEERFGYQAFQELWSLSRRPEGVVVWPDTVAQGAVKALLERQVQVPAELKLVLGKNAHLDWFCPVPARYAVLDETALARALIEQVQKQFRGETVQLVAVPHKLVAGTFHEASHG